MHLHFWPEEQVLTEGAQGGLAVSPLSLNLSLSESAVKTDDVSPDLCQTSPLSRVWAQMVPVVQHQLQTYAPGGLTPRSSEMALKALQLQNNQVFKVCFLQCSTFSKYGVPSATLLSSHFQMHNFENVAWRVHLWKHWTPSVPTNVNGKWEIFFIFFYSFLEIKWRRYFPWKLS